MIGKAGLAAALVLSMVAAGRAVDLRQLYNEMYPVNTLKRDAFNLCRQSDPTFIRALEEDRESCYDRMPHSFALAIGRIQPGNPLASLFVPGAGLPGAALLPEAALYSWAAATRHAGMHRGRFVRGATPCSEPPGPASDDRLLTAETLDALAGRSGASPAAPLRDAGLLPRDHQSARGQPVPPLPAASGAGAQRPAPLVPLDAAAASDLGDDPAASAETGCPAHI